MQGQSLKLLNQLRQAQIDSDPVAPALDADAQAFITAVSTLTEAQEIIVNDLVIDLKAAGLWTVQKAIYPFIGGTAAAHKWNLKDPRDLDAAYRLTFTGSWTHSVTGGRPFSGARADTHLAPNPDLSRNDNHFSYYSRTSGGQANGCLGTANNSGGSQAYITKRWTDGNEYITNNSSSYSNSTTTDTGLTIVSRLNSSTFSMLRGGRYDTTSRTSQTPTTNSFYLGTARTITSSPNGRECAFSTFGEGLTQTQMVDLNAIIQDFNTELNRQL